MGYKSTFTGYPTYCSDSPLLLKAKEILFQTIDHYLREKIVLADKAISTATMKVINEGDVILVYAQ